MTLKNHIDPFHPIRLYFVDALQRSLRHEVGLPEDDAIEEYLVDLLLEFLRSDRLFGLRGQDGRPIRSVAEMLLEADVRFNADSFEREREVNKHIGDFAIFATGLFPEAVGTDSVESLIDYAGQGKHAYYVVSTFDYGRYADEAPMFGRLSEGFDAYRHGLTLVRASFEGFARQGWGSGFEA